MPQSTSPHGLIGVVHLAAMPGDPAYTTGGFAAVEKAAMVDAEHMANAGIKTIIVENFGSAPFVKGTTNHRLPPHQVAFMAILINKLVTSFGLQVGVNCLRNDAHSALGIAVSAGASFIRVNVHTGAYVTDQGLIEGEAAATLRYRAEIGAQSIAICADVLVKHATPLAPLDPGDATKDTLLRGLADSVIVTGRSTGGAVDKTLLEQVRKAAGSSPVLIGSGLTPTLADSLAPLVEGAIVGTWIKQNGLVHNPVDPQRVKELMAACAGKFRSLL